jgi:hypothetical protein
MPDPIVPEAGASASPAAPALAPQTPAASPIVPATPPAIAKTAPEADAVEKRISAAVAKAHGDLLQSLGAKDLDELKTAHAKFREAEEAQKSELQKQIERATKLEAEAKAGATYRERLGQMVNAQVASLTPEQKAAVERLAGNDPLKIADALEVLRPTWAAAPAPSGQTPAPPPPPPAPATTALPAGAPPAGAQKNKYQEYEEIQRNKPALAPYFYAANKQAIEAARPVPSN